MKIQLVNRVLMAMAIGIVAGVCWTQARGGQKSVVAPSKDATKPRTENARQNHNVLNIGSRLELFVDDFLVAGMTGVARKLHSPQPRDVALKFDSPWDGECSLYVSVFQDDDKFRMYYRGMPADKVATGLSASGRSVTCYAESTDGIHWEKPKLGLYKCERSGRNDTNIVMVRNKKWPNVVDNFAVFKDANPQCPPEARYKAVGRHWLPVLPDGEPGGACAA